MAGAAGVFAPTFASETVAIDLSQKPVDTPTLDYLKDNNILIPQKGEYNKTDKTWGEADPIPSPGSAYTITVGTEADHTFDYTMADKDGNLTHNYYKITLSPPLEGGDAGEGLALGTSKNIKWEEVSAPIESSDKQTGTVAVTLPNNVTKYYKYTYTQPDNYDLAPSRINNTLDSENATHKVFEGLSAFVGGAIYNTQDKSTVDIVADFINNSASVSGGAIYNSGTIGDITGDFIKNSVSGSGYGGAIYNSGIIGDITGDFIGNHASSSGGAIYNYYGTIGDITGDFINNSGSGSGLGGAIYSSYGIIGNITGDFINNSATSSGGAIYNENGTIGNIIGDFIRNSANSYGAYGGAIYNSGTISSLAGDYIGNSVIVSKKGVGGNIGPAKGGAIYNTGTIDKIVNSSFINNSARIIFEGGVAQGGAIWTNKDLNIIADGQTSTFKDNYTQIGEERDDNAIYVDGATLNFQLKNNGQVAMYDNIRGANGYKVDITGDSVDTTFYMCNDMYDANLIFGNTTLNTANNAVHTYNVNSLTVKSDTNMIADVDLANKEMDRFTAEEYGKHTGNLNVSGMNLLSDAKDPKTEIYFAQEGLKDNVTTTVTEVAYTPIYKYNVRYENRDDAGYFVFDRGGSNGGSTGGNSSDAFNPAVLSSPVSSVAAAQATINETFKYVFEHADAFTQLPSVERMARINANKYALHDSHDGVSTDFNHNLGSLCPDHNNKAAWFRPYATFETMHLKNGPKVDAITYGSLAGFDTDFHEHKHGWHSVGTGYIGYNGSQLSYKGVDTTMNGGIFGYTHTMYKGNFWTALTLSAGASVGESRTMYGKEDFTSLMAGVGSKTGYNFEFKEGKYILQPIMFMSYTFVNTFDYTNAAGVKINADPAHSIQLNPSVRFISNFKNGWQPYASVGMVWNVMNENNVTANNVRLPEMSMKPYVEYGVGVQRNWKDKFTAFGQAMLRNGGRNGIALTAGFRWALGKDTPHNHDKVEAPKTDRTVLKQLTPQQKMALTGKKNTTITSAKAVLKQL